MTVILAIDPGPVRSAWLRYDTDTQMPLDFDLVPNEFIRLHLRAVEPRQSQLVIEKIESYGMAVGVEVFETVFWSGRFAEAAYPLPVDRLGRLKVKLALCHDSRAKDPNIRQALIDRFGGVAAIGKKATPGPLYGIAGDVWSALAVAVAWTDGAR